MLKRQDDASDRPSHQTNRASFESSPQTTSGLRLFSVENVTMHGKRKLDKSTAATQGSRVSVKTMR